MTLVSGEMTLGRLDLKPSLSPRKLPTLTPLQISLSKTVAATVKTLGKCLTCY